MTGKPAGFGEWLRAARKLAGLSQREAARRLGVSHVYWHGVEAGDKPPFADHHAGTLAEALGLPQELAWRVLRLSSATWRAHRAARQLRQAVESINVELAALGYSPYEITIEATANVPEIH